MLFYTAGTSPMVIVQVFHLYLNLTIKSIAITPNSTETYAFLLSLTGGCPLEGTTGVLLRK
ncbi:hypothetical protein C9994_14175 [Marivirga lumbricoides]|uniref:Uncharacterized protein n=1 Tax=Marivirga lumbricoides TaxID=1046115 RepID=A0A2T4DF53_9BACT|nr:hypothetical protein C9994_14175 [Marivirga lumbricoides]